MPPRKGSAKDKGETPAAKDESDEGLPTHFPLWPGDEHISHTEYFNPTQAKAFKEAKSVKWPWEDPYGLTWTPVKPSAGQTIWVRPDQAFPRVEGEEQTVLATERFDMVAGTPPTTATEAAYLRKKKLEYTPRMIECSADLLSTNTHLMSSDLMRTVIAHLAELQCRPNDNSPHSVRPWELIFPQTKNTNGDTIPTFSASGKYAVKLFWLGAWRKILIDDLMPQSNEGILMYPCSPLDCEMWPILVTKAIVKVLYMYRDETPQGCEYADAEILQMLTGWSAQRIPVAIDPAANAATTAMMHQRCLRQIAVKPVAMKEPEPPSSADTESKTGSGKGKKGKKTGRVSRVPSTTGGKLEKKNTEVEPESVPEPVDAHRVNGLVYIGARLRTFKREPVSSFDTQIEQDGEGLRNLSAATSRNLSAPPSRATTPWSKQRVSFSHTVGISNEQTSNEEDDGLAIDANFKIPKGCASASHQVRVLECIYLPAELHGKEVDPSDTANWVVRCQSAISEFNGRLSYADPGAWGSTLSLGCKVSREAQRLRSTTSFDNLEAHQPFELFQFHMYLDEFYRAFSDVTVHHKIELHVTKTLEMLKGGRMATLRSSANTHVEPEKPPDPKAPEVVDLSAGQAYFFCYDSTAPTDVVVSLSVGPAESPKAIDEPRLVTAAAEALGPEGEAAAAAAILHPAGAAAAGPLAVPERGGVIFEQYLWTDSKQLGVSAELSTTVDATTTMSVPGGKHMFRIVPVVSGAFSVAVTVPAGFKGTAELRDEHRAWEFLSDNSIQLQVTATDTCKLMDAIFKCQHEYSMRRLNRKEKMQTESIEQTADLVDTKAVVRHLEVLNTLLGGDINETMRFLQAARSCMALAYEPAAIEGSPKDAQFVFFEENGSYARCGIIWHRVIQKLCYLVNKELSTRADEDQARDSPELTTQALDAARLFGGSRAENEDVAGGDAINSTELDNIHTKSSGAHKAVQIGTYAQVGRNAEGEHVMVLASSTVEHDEQQKAAKFAKLHRMVKSAKPRLATATETYTTETGIEPRGKSAPYAKAEPMVKYVEFLPPRSAKNVREKRKAKAREARMSNASVTDEMRNQYAQVIQRCFRGHLAKKKMAESREAQMLVDHDFFLESWGRVTDKNMLDFGILLFKRYAEISENDDPRTLPFGKDEAMRGGYHQFIGSFDEKIAGQWFILFKDTFKFDKPTTVSLALRVGLPKVLVEGTDDTYERCFQLTVVDNDTMEFVPVVFGQPLPFICRPNRLGYTFMAAGQCPVALPQIGWALRMISQPLMTWDAERTLKANAEIPAKVESGPVLPKKTPGSGAQLVDPTTGETTVMYDVLFRYDVLAAGSVESPPPPQVFFFHLSVNPAELPDAVLELELVKDGEVIMCATGVGAVAFPLIKLEGSTAIPGKDAKGAKGKGKGKPPASAKRPQTPAGGAATGAGADTERAVVLHPYVLRGRILAGSTPPVVADEVDDKAAKKKKAAKGAPTLEARGPVWKLEAFADVDLILTEHAQREDAIQEQKDGWEAVEEGRAAKAGAARQAFIASTAPPADFAEDEGAGAAQPGRVAVAKGSALPVRVYDSSLQTEREAERNGLLKSYKRGQSAKREQRVLVAARRASLKKAHIGKFRSQLRAKVQNASLVGDHRKAFRARLLQEQDTFVRLEGMRAAICEAEMELREMHDPNAKGKKKKK